VPALKEVVELIAFAYKEPPIPTPPVTTNAPVVVLLEVVLLDTFVIPLNVFGPANVCVLLLVVTTPEVVAEAAGTAGVVHPLLYKVNVKVGPLLVPSVQVQVGVAKLGTFAESGLKIVP